MFLEQKQLKTIFNIFSRVGKFIIFILDKPYVLICHLRMEGKFFLRKEGEKYSVHDMAIFHFENGTYLAYNDTRRFGILKVLDKENYKNHFVELAQIHL